MGNRRMRAWLAAWKYRVLAGVAACLLLAGCQGGAAGAETGQASEAPGPSGSAGESTAGQAPYRLGIGYSGGYEEAFPEWAEQVYERTDGNVEIFLYGDNVLGEGADMLQAVQNGTLSMMGSSTSVHTGMVPEAAVLDIPACFEEYIQPYQVYDGVFYDKLNACYREQGLELIYLRTGEYWILTSSHPITSLEQLQGVQIRTIGASVHDQLYQRLGIGCVSGIGLNGLSYALEEGRVDGIETTYTILRSQNLAEAQPCALESPMFVMGSAIVMNYEIYQSMPSDYQRILKETLKEILDEQQVKMEQEEDARREGLQVSRLSEADQAALRELAQPLLEELTAELDPELLEALVRENGGG